MLASALRTCRTLALLTVAAYPASAQQDPVESELAPVGHAGISAVYDLDAAPPYAYALERQNLRVLDVRDPTDVREIANLPFEGPRVRSVLYGSHLYLVGFGEPIGVVEIGDPGSPRWLGELSDLDGTFSAWAVGDVLWVLRDLRSLTLEALDLRDVPARPRRLSTLDFGIDLTPWPRAVGLSHDAGRLFVLVNSRSADRSWIFVVDASDPAAPTVERRIPLPEGRHFNDLAVRDDLFYLITRDPDGLAVYRFHGDAEVELLGAVTDPRLWYGADLVLRNEIIHASFKGDIVLATFDVSNPARPKLADAFVPEGWTAAGLGFSIAGDRLYLSGDAGPSPIFDISEPRSPRYVGRWNYHGGWAADLLPLDLGSPEREVLAVLNRWFGVYLYDISNPRQPRRLARHDRGESYQRVNAAARADRLMITYDSLPAELIDVSVPEAPAVIGRVLPSGTVTAVALTSEHALFGYAERGVGAVRLESVELESVEPMAPRARKGSTGGTRPEPSGPVAAISGSNDLALAVRADGTVTVIDLADPAGPRFSGLAGEDPDVPEMPDWRSAGVALSRDRELALTVHGTSETDSGTVVLSVYEPGRSAGPGHETGLRALARLPLLGAVYPERFPVVISDGEVLAAVGRELLRIDLSDPSRPLLTARHRLKMTMDAEGLARKGQLVYVGAGEDGLLIFELPE